MVSLDKKLGAAPLSDASLRMAEREVFAYHQGMGTGKYLHWEALWNSNGTGWMQQLRPIEEDIFRTTEPLLEKWREKGAVDEKEMKLLYMEIEEILRCRDVKR